MRKYEWIDFAIALVVGAVFVCIAAASEPPPSNLPAATGGVCKCGVACECGDQVTIATKTGAVSSTWTKAAPVPAKSYAIEKRYTKIGRRTFVEDVLVEVSQPAAISYAAPQQIVTYQNQTTNCPNGKCPYVR